MPRKRRYRNFGYSMTRILPQQSKSLMVAHLSTHVPTIRVLSSSPVALAVAAPSCAATLPRPPPSRRRGPEAMRHNARKVPCGRYNHRHQYEQANYAGGRARAVDGEQTRPSCGDRQAGEACYHGRSTPGKLCDSRYDGTLLTGDQH
jgi:hypothetical protein